MKKLQTIAKFAGVSVDELMKEFDDEDRRKTESSKPVEERASPLSFLPAPQNKSEETDANEPRETEVNNTNDTEVDDTKGNGIIPLNPFLNDVQSIQTTSQADVEQEPIQYITVSRVERRQTEKKPERKPETESVTMPVQHGYGGSFSQSQYEAFIRRSGMMATVNAATSASANMLVATGDECEGIGRGRQVLRQADEEGARGRSYYRVESERPPRSQRSAGC